MSEDSMRRRLSSPAPAPAAAALPDDDDLLQEILLRLPPLPSSLPRASLVCKRCRRLLTDPQFLHRFSAFHSQHQGPPLLGFFFDIFGPDFTPTLDQPDCIPRARLSLRRSREEEWQFLGCRHGLGLRLDRKRLQVTVWDPITGNHRSVAVPPELFSTDGPSTVCTGALVCDGGYSGCGRSKRLKVILLDVDGWIDHDPQAFASLYDSNTGGWSDLVSTTIKAPLGMTRPGILVENSFCWLFRGCETGEILLFDLDRRSLATIEYPAAVRTSEASSIQILLMEDGGLGVPIASGRTIQLWERKASSVGIAAWMLQKTIELDKLFSLPSQMESLGLVILGYDEDGHVIFLWTYVGVFMVQLKSMQFRKLS